ncbi:hypothetical protein EMCRGX_G017006 [Ephydatia muelleri]
MCSLGVEEVVRWLRERNFEECEVDFRENQIDGDALLMLGKSSLRELKQFLPTIKPATLNGLIKAIQVGDFQIAEAGARGSQLNTRISRKESTSKSYEETDPTTYVCYDGMSLL